MFTIIGQTTDGKAVLAGVYKTFETHGLPLDILLDVLLQKDAIPCWMSFYREASAAGMKHERILSKLEGPLSDVYGGEFQKVVFAKLELLHEKGLL